MEKVFEHEAEFRLALSSVLVGSGVPAAAADVIAERAAEACSEERIVGGDPTGRAMGFLLRKRCWVIRDDDLRVLDAVLASLATPAALGVLLRLHVTSDAAALALAGAAAAALKLAWAAKKKGANVLPLHAAILAALKVRPDGMSAADLATWLNATRADNEPPFTPAAVEEELLTLARVRVGDGNVVAFVAQDAEGAWSAAGI